jgi:hypothetical protein
MIMTHFDFTHVSHMVTVVKTVLDLAEIVEKFSKEKTTRKKKHKNR